jgi:hypothetical protein
MRASLRALLTGLIDYAGLFPPAKLAMEEAIANYARYRIEPEAWMLGRFVCPASRLAELSAYLELFRSGPPLAFSVLGRGGKDAEEFLTGLHADLRATEAFREKHGGQDVIDVYETRLPDEVFHFTTLYLPELGLEPPAYLLELARREKMMEAILGESMSLIKLLAQASELFASADLPRFTPYWEIPWSEHWGKTWTGAIHMLGILNQTSLAYREPVPYFRPGGIKVRCGGLEATAFPSAEQLAAVVTSCRDQAVPFKATAGLHRPLPRFASDVQARMHGFLNLFGAAALTYANRLNEDQVRTILEDDDPQSFVFDDDGFRWKDLRVKIAKIGEARKKFAMSFGSCSFDEPREDLRALGLI